MAKGRDAKTRAKGTSLTKAVKAERPAPSSQQETPHFCFRYADRRTMNAWRFDPSADDATSLFVFICAMCQLTWAEIQKQTAGGHRKHHDQRVASIETEPQKDYRKAHLDKTFGDDHIFRFRVTGEKRLWGFRRNRTFHVVWWDPDHLVYETEPD